MMVSINKELKAAKAAKATIDWLLTASAKSAALGALKRAKNVAVSNLSSGGPSNQILNEARSRVGIALSSLVHGLPTREKIDKAKRAIEAWIRELEAAKPTA
jgi:hypothetical protein